MYHSFIYLRSTMLLVGRHLSRGLQSPGAGATLARAFAASSVAAPWISPAPPAAAVAANRFRPQSISTPTAFPVRTLTSSSSLKESYDYILVEKRFPETGEVVGGGVGVVTLHRPKALNALCDALFEDLIHAVRAFEDDDEIGCIVVTGSGKAFAAGENCSNMAVEGLWLLCATIFSHLTVISMLSQARISRK